MGGDFDVTDFFSTDFYTGTVTYPDLEFIPTVINYGTVPKGESCAMFSYLVKQAAAGHQTAYNLSISIEKSVNSDELEAESWVYCSTSEEGTRITSIPGGKQCQAPSVPDGSSIAVRTKIVVPVGASTTEDIVFKLYHKYQYTG